MDMLLYLIITVVLAAGSVATCALVPDACVPFAETIFQWFDVTYIFPPVYPYLA